MIVTIFAKLIIPTLRRVVTGERQLLGQFELPRPFLKQKQNSCFSVLTLKKTNKIYIYFKVGYHRDFSEASYRRPGAARRDQVRAGGSGQ